MRSYCPLCSPKCRCVSFLYRHFLNTRYIVLFVSGDPQDPPGRVKDGHVFGNQINNPSPNPNHGHNFFFLGLKQPILGNRQFVENGERVMAQSKQSTRWISLRE